MATSHRPDARAVALFEAIRAAPQRYGFFAALRRIECAFRQRPRLGQSKHAADDPVRLAQVPSLAFAASEMHGLEWDEGAKVPRLVTRFLGLFGPHGPLPLHLSEYARDRLRNLGDRTLTRFADIFHHRMLSLFYRAFAQSEPTISADRPSSDSFSRYVGAVVGAGLPGAAGGELDDRVRLYYAGHFSAQPRTADGLRALVADALGVPVEIEELVGEWVEVPPRARWKLGEAALGAGAVVGARAFLCQSKFRLVIGPVDASTFATLLPDTDNFEFLSSMVRSYVGDELTWDAQIIMEPQSRPMWSLGRSQLGWTTALGRLEDERPSIIVKPRPPKEAQEHGRN